MSDKTFNVAGWSTLDGEIKPRFANDLFRIKVLERNGHKDVQLFQLPNAMTKEAAVAWILEQHPHMAAQLNKPAKSTPPAAPKATVVAPTATEPSLTGHELLNSTLLSPDTQTEEPEAPVAEQPVPAEQVPDAKPEVSPSEQPSDSANVEDETLAEYFARIPLREGGRFLSKVARRERAIALRAAETAVDVPA